MSDLQLIDSLPIWKSVLWCFYPITLLVLLELVARGFHDDDDDFGAGKMIPAYQTARVR